MKVKKQSRSDKDDKLTIEDVIELGGDQVMQFYCWPRLFLRRLLP